MNSLNLTGVGFLRHVAACLITYVRFAIGKEPRVFRKSLDVLVLKCVLTIDKLNGTKLLNSENS